MVFRGNIVTSITGNTFSDQGMLFGAFLMENIFHQKCPKQHSLATGSVGGDAGDDISSKNHEKFMLFLTSHPLWDSL